MSLTVSPEIKAHAKGGTLTHDAFYECIKESLPFAVDVIHRLAHEADHSESDMAEFAPASLSDQDRGQLLRATASNAIRSALEMRFASHQHRATRIMIGFKNCHNVGVFLGTSKGRRAFKKWTSKESQILAQSPELIDC